MFKLAGPNGHFNNRDQPRGRQGSKGSQGSLIFPCDHERENLFKQILKKMFSLFSFSLKWLTS